MKIGREELANCLIYQIGALKAFLDAEGMPLHHIKPHGSLYGMAARTEEIAHAICDAADVFKVPLLGMIGTLHETIYPRRGHVFVSEYYTDLDYGDDGQLVITREHHAVDPAQAAAPGSFAGEAARQWLRDQMSLAKEFLTGVAPRTSFASLPDGGEVAEGALLQCDPGAWAEFERRFTSIHAPAPATT
jgi:hypothetical protein